MSTMLFKSVREGHDGKGRVVHLCQDAAGFYVYKPATGFRTRHWKSLDTKALIACFNRQVVCTQNTGFFEKGEAPTANEDYSLTAKKATAAADAKAAVNAAPPASPKLDDAAAGTAPSGDQQQSGEQKV